MTCQHCRKTVMLPGYRLSKFKYCSRSCGAQAFVPQRESRRIEVLKAKTGSGFSREEKLRRKREYAKAFYAANADLVRARNAKRYAENKDKHAAAGKRWRAANSAKLREQNRIKRAKNGEHIRAARRRHYRDNKPRYVANARKREEHIKRATPPWADLEKIAAFYVEADQLTRETGIKHVVDHYYPLISKVMCGLHVETNLQVITQAANLKKSNSIPPPKET